MAYIFTAEKLIEFNKKMLGRGKPNQHDGIGYNKADYSACELYYEGLSNAQLADLASRLAKYCNTQLKVNKEDMLATFKKYSHLSYRENRVNGVSIDIEQDDVILIFKYNERFIDTIRKLPSRRFDTNSKRWIVPLNKAEEALLKLEAVGADTKNALKYIQNSTLKGVVK